MADLINRQDAIDALSDYIHNMDKVIGTGKLSKEDCRDAAESVFDELPSAQSERKKGKWELRTDEKFDIDYYKCSECGYEPYRKMDISNFCPNCGADMREGDA